MIKGIFMNNSNLKALAIIMLTIVIILIGLVIDNAMVNKNKLINNCIEKNPNKIEQCQKL